jgi:hypothetical protein
MAVLTEAQAELLAWIIESASGAVLFTPMLSEPDSVIPARGGGEEYQMEASDLRELEAQGLLRRLSGSGHEVTNAGRIAYEQLKNPPPEPPPVGFQPN